MAGDSLFTHSFFQETKVGKYYTEDEYFAILKKKVNASTPEEMELHSVLIALHIQGSIQVSCRNHHSSTTQSYEISSLTPGTKSPH